MARMEQGDEKEFSAVRESQYGCIEAMPVVPVEAVADARAQGELMREPSGWYRSRRHVRWDVAFLLLALGLLALTLRVWNGSDSGEQQRAHADVDASAGATSACGSCASDVCELQACPASDYLCTSGSAKWGCSSDATLWPSSPELCDACCDTSACADDTAVSEAVETSAAASVESSDCAACSEAQCALEACPADAPYMCTEGSSKLGCSSDATLWSTSDLCSSCCDISRCS